MRPRRNIPYRLRAAVSGLFNDLCWSLYCRMSARDARIRAAQMSARYPWGRE